MSKSQIGGKLAQLGQRLVQGTAKKLADDFFNKFAAAVAAGWNKLPVLLARGLAGFAAIKQSASDFRPPCPMRPGQLLDRGRRAGQHSASDQAAPLAARWLDPEMRRMPCLPFR